MVSHEAKKLHANTSGGPLARGHGVHGVDDAQHAEDQQGPAHEHSVTGGPGQVKPASVPNDGAVERLSGMDASFLYFETPSMHMHVAMTAIFDPSTMPGGYSFEKVKEFIESRLHLVPPFRRRVVEVPFRLNHPIWVEDPDFDLDYHIRRIGRPSPGGHEELAELAAQIASTPLDRSRPLWELYVVEGLADGNIGVVTKMHHCAVDGVSGAELMVNLFDLDPEGREIEPPEPREPEPIPSDLEMVGHAVASRARRQLGLLPLLGTTARTVGTLVSRRRDPEATRRGRAAHRAAHPVERRRSRRTGG